MLVLATAVAVLIAGPEIVRRFGHARTDATVKEARDWLSQDNNILSQASRTTRSVAKAIEASVVHITVRDKVLHIKNATGSGWVYDQSGHIITNHHVIQDDGIIEVRFHDGTRKIATLVGADPKTDVAVLWVDAMTNLIPAARASSKPVFQGDLVFAFGSPMGFEFSMTSGIVSGKGRQSGLSTEYGAYENFIQTDAAINPGNSGGPLTNVRGEVVGMNFAVVRQNAPSITNRFTNTGIGLAIPLDLVEFVADQIINTGLVKRGGLGISWEEIEDLGPTVRKDLGYEGQGILITQVAPESPAEGAGLRIDDVLFAVDSEPIMHGQSFRTVVHARKPGEQVILSIWRAGQQLQLAIILGEWDRITQNLPEITHTAPSRDFDSLGITLTELSDALKTMFQNDINSGLYIQSVRVNSIAWDLGFKAGVIILMVDEQPVRTLVDFNDFLRTNDRPQGMTVTILKPDGERRVIHLPPTNNG